MPERRLRAGAPEREAPSPAIRRLRRLRISLTLLFTVVMALGLAALALVVIHKDSEARMDSLEGVMGRRVSGSSRLIYYSNRGKLRLDGLRDDDLTAGSPEVRAFAGTGANPRQVFAGVRHKLPLSYAQLAAIVHRATATEGLVGATVTDRDGTRVRLLAGPYYRDPNGNAGGAVVSAASLAKIESEHRELVLTIVLGCVGLLLLAALAGYLLAGRSLRPAARALAEQEALLADAAHELRTPIASIRATLEAAQLEPAGANAAIESARATSAAHGRHARRAARLGPAGSGRRADRPVRAAPRPAGRGRRRRGRSGRADRRGGGAGRRDRRSDPDPGRGPQPPRQRAATRGRDRARARRRRSRSPPAR